MELAAKLVGAGYIRQGSEAVRRREKHIEELLEHRKLPVKGWDELTLLRLVNELALLDSNNFEGNCGAGEREARVVCEAVRRRHFNLGHGIGRSGDVGAVQPKAAGSSVICKLTAELVRDLFRRVLQMRSTNGVLMLPLATGMSLSLVMQTLRHTEALKRPNASPKYVLWPRIDQKTCLKSIVTAGYSPVVIENRILDDCVITDLDAIQDKIKELGPDSILCILSTTSCFSPRVPDDVEGIAKLCKEYNIAHVINNAYGMQCTKCCHYVEQASKNGRVDAIVQSTDKNLMVPVGGAIVTGPNKEFVEVQVSKMYPGRASMSPILDVFLTLMSLGSEGYSEIRKRRLSLVSDFKKAIAEVAHKHGERVLETSNRNTISFAVTLSGMQNDPQSLTKFGSMLFTRGVSGARVVAPGTPGTVSGISFSSYGASSSEYPCAYVTVACAIGISKEEIDQLAKRLDQTFSQFKRSSTAAATEQHKSAHNEE